MSAPTV